MINKLVQFLFLSTYFLIQQNFFSIAGWNSIYTVCCYLYICVKLSYFLFDEEFFLFIIWFGFCSHFTRKLVCWSIFFLLYSIAILLNLLYLFWFSFLPSAIYFAAFFMQSILPIDICICKQICRHQSAIVKWDRISSNVLAFFFILRLYFHFVRLSKILYVFYHMNRILLLESIINVVTSSSSCIVYVFISQFFFLFFCCLFAIYRAIYYIYHILVIQFWIVFDSQ